MVIDTLKTNFDIDIHHYIELNFLSFVDLVNTLGDVPVYVPYAVRDVNTGLGLPNGGCWPLNGEQAPFVGAVAVPRVPELRNRTVGVRQPNRARLSAALPGNRTSCAGSPGIAVTKSLANPFTANDVADDVVKNLKVDDAFDKGAIFDLIDAFRTINVDDQSALEFATMPSKATGDQRQGSLLTADGHRWPQLILRLRTFDTRPKPTPAPSTSACGS